MAEKDDNKRVHQVLSEISSDSGNRHVEEDLKDFNLNNNTSARIKNPLAGLSHDSLMRDVENFANEHQLHEITPLLKKGALVAQNPGEFETLDGLDESERTVLREEVTNK